MWSHREEGAGHCSISRKLLNVQMSTLSTLYFDLKEILEKLEPFPKQKARRSATVGNLCNGRAPFKCTLE